MQDKEEKHKQNHKIRKINLNDSSQDDQLSDQLDEVSQLKHNLYEANMKVYDLNIKISQYLLQRQQEAKKYNDMQNSFKQQISFLKEDKRKLQKQKEHCKKQLVKVIQQKKIEVDQLKQQLNALVAQNRLTPNFNSVNKELGETQLIIQMIKKDQKITNIQKQNKMLKQLVQKSTNRNSFESFSQNNQKDLIESIDYQKQQLKTNLQQLKKVLKQQQAKCKEQQILNKQLQLKYEQLSKKIQDKINQNIKYKKQNADYQNKINSNLIQKTNKNNQLSSSLKIIQQLKQNNLSLSKNIKFLSKELQEKEKQLQDQICQIKNLEKNFIDIQNQSKSYQKQLQITNSSNIQLKVKLSNFELTQRKMIDMTNKINQLNYSLKQKQEEAKQLKKKNNQSLLNQKDFYSSSTKKEHRILQLQSYVKQLQKQAEQLKNSQRIDKQQVKTLKLKINRLQGRKLQLKEQKSKISEEAKKIMTKLKEESNNYKLKSQLIQQKNNQLSQRFEELNQKYMTCRNNQTANIHIMQQQNYKQNKQLQQKLQNLISQNKRFVSQNKRLADLIEQNQKKNNYQSILNQCQKLKHQNELISSKYASLKLQNQKQFLDQQIQTQEINKSHQIQFQNLKQEYSNLNHQRYALQDKIHVLKQQKELYKQQSEVLTIKIHQFQKKITSQNDPQIQYEKQVNLLRKQIYKLTNQLDNYKNLTHNRIPSLSNVSSPQKKYLRDSVDSFNNSNEAVVNIQEELCELKYQIQILKLQKEQHFKKVKNLQEKLQVSQNNFDHYDSLRVSGGKSQNNYIQYQQQIERLKSLLNHRQNLIQKMSNKLHIFQTNQQSFKQLHEQTNRLKLQINLVHDQKKQLFQQISKLKSSVQKYEIEKQKQKTQLYSDFKNQMEQKLHFIDVQVKMIRQQRDKLKQQKLQLQSKYEKEIQMRQKRYGQQRSKLCVLIEELERKQNFLKEKLISINKSKQQEMALRKQITNNFRIKDEEYFTMKYQYFKTLQDLNKTLKQKVENQKQNSKKISKLQQQYDKLLYQNQLLKKQFGNIRNFNNQNKQQNFQEKNQDCLKFKRQLQKCNKENPIKDHNYLKVQQFQQLMNNKGQQYQSSQILTHQKTKFYRYQVPSNISWNFCDNIYKLKQKDRKELFEYEIKQKQPLYFKI